MKFTTLSRLLGCVFLALLAGRVFANPEFETWSTSFTDAWVRANPQLATRTQYFSGAEQAALDREMAMAGSWGTTYGLTAANQHALLAQEGLTALRRFPRESLTPAEQTSAALIQWALEDVIAQAQFAPQQFIFEQFKGLQLELIDFLTQTHPIRQKADIENYLVRLRRVAPLIDEGIAEARAAGEAGIRPPRFIVERTIAQLDGFLAPPPRENVFVHSLDERIAALGDAVSQPERARYLATAGKVVRDEIIPAYARVRSLLAAQLPETTDEAGISRLPNGDEAYAQALRTYTTTNLSPDQVHVIGQREVARIEGEMDKILRSLGYSDGTVEARYQQLQAAEQPAAEPDPRPALLARNERTVRDAEKRSAALFDVRPLAPVVVRREPALTENSAAAHYTPPAPDGTQPGIYWLPLPGPTFKVLSMRSLSYHEAVPGHHFQLTVQQESTELPRFRKLGVFGFISAYGEGWALYAERLADESGWYDGDPKGRLGYLSQQLFRARRLVVDTGLHAMKWTRQQAIDFGIPAAEVERYVVWPGQACSYMIGQLKIVELRENAKAELGAKFSLKEFHNAVLKGGNVPLDVLAEEVGAWVAAKKRE
ncbi:DUF885 domain-containing protein [Horticoccus luteus]|uniref:DUF885 domain-containing protein n=1 Tax=Horticoccus luteus TaxID=2862869 RepID=A0A8F9TVC1_9BACT|nr:DUF885 domain-containing protein [Horticoccus luteus]QYM78454.1 DUF885 domain-containing protein [Horticoccus luteus]